MFSLVTTIFPFALIMFVGCLIAEAGFRGLKPASGARPTSAVLFLLSRLHPSRQWGDETAIARRESLFLLAFGVMMVIIGLMDLNLAFA
ncbi:MAG: hypothetical protein ACT4QE_06015 [Anaerolineales bacterium]